MTAMQKKHNFYVMCILRFRKLVGSKHTNDSWVHRLVKYELRCISDINVFEIIRFVNLRRHFPQIMARWKRRCIKAVRDADP